MSKSAATIRKESLVSSEYARPVISRKEAKSSGLVRYFTGKPCKTGHFSERHTKSASCCECKRLMQSAYRSSLTPDQKAAASERDRKHNQSRKLDEGRIAYMKAYLSEYQSKNREKISQRNRDWRRSRIGKELAREKANRVKLRDYFRGQCQKRRAAKQQRIPAWFSTADSSAIRSMHRECNDLEELTGIKFHVDHVIPLCGQLVSGLHIPINLRVIPYYMNLQKGNSFSV
jgi:hypothetical protein